MKIVKGAERSRIEWTVRKLVEMVEDGNVNFDINIQRGYVWKDKNRKSALIRSLILDRHIPPLYFNKVDGIFEGEDGKQRTLTIIKFLKDEFELTGLPLFEIINDDGELEEFDINGYYFSGLPECFQNAIKEYSFSICFTDNAEPEEVADTFYNLNNGQSLNAATLNRITAKSKEQIIELGKHKLFSEALSAVALEGHVEDTLVARAHAILNEKEPAMDTSWIRPYMKRIDINEQDVKVLNQVFDRIYNIHNLIEDKKIAKRIYGRTHMISIIPVVLKSIEKGLSDEQMMEWFVNFFSGRRSATISHTYNSAAGSGSGKKDAVRKRLTAIDEHWNEYFKDTLASVK